MCPNVTRRFVSKFLPCRCHRDQKVILTLPLWGRTGDLNLKIFGQICPHQIVTSMCHSVTWKIVQKFLTSPVTS